MGKEEKEELILKLGGEGWRKVIGGAGGGDEDRGNMFKTLEKKIVL